MRIVTREDVVQSIKSICVPKLRELGFKGSFPNFYRLEGEFVSLLNFQFFSSGGSLCVNISYADPARENIAFRPETEPRKLRVGYARRSRRLGAPAGGGDRWFSFGSTSYGGLRGKPIDPSELANELNNLLDSDAEPWWAAHRE